MTCLNEEGFAAEQAFNAGNMAEAKAAIMSCWFELNETFNQRKANQILHHEKSLEMLKALTPEAQARPAFVRAREEFEQQIAELKSCFFKASKFRFPQCPEEEVTLLNFENGCGLLITCAAGSKRMKKVVLHNQIELFFEEVNGLEAELVS